MREDIRKRIEQIRRGEVPEGYDSETQIGILPKDWKINTIGEVVRTIVGGGTPSRRNAKYFEGHIPWVTVKDLNGDFYKCDASEHITSEAIEKSASKLIESGNVIVSTRMGLGRGFINKVPMAINQDMKALLLKTETSTEFFLYWYLNVGNRILELGGGSTVKGISLNTLRSICLPFPPHIEQERIAEILSTCDRVIELKKKLIEEKRKVKKWLMQTLLTGMIRVKDIENGTPYEELKKRIEQIRNGQIPEGYRRIGSIGIFPRDWTTVSLKTLSLFIRDGTHGTHKNYEDGVPLLSAKNVRDGRVFVDKTDRTISEEDYRHIHRHYELEPGDILMTIVGTVGRTATITHDLPRFTIQRSISIIRPREEHITEFLKNTLNTHYYQQQLYKLLNASAQGGVYLGALEKTKLVIPATNKEELQTAEILSTADKEIDLLNKDLEQLELKKKSLLQLLLTGIVRPKA